MRRTYRSKRETGDGLDPRDLMHAVDSKGTLFDAFYIQNIKQTKRELTVNSIQSGASKKVRKRKYVKRLKEQEPIQDFPSTSTYLTPDKSIHVNKATDLFDKLLNSSVQKHPKESTKASDILDKLLNESVQNHSQEPIKASDLFDKLSNESVQKKSIEPNKVSELFDKLLNESVQKQSKEPMKVVKKISKKSNKRSYNKNKNCLQRNINFFNKDSDDTSHKERNEINELSELSFVVTTGKENINPNCNASIEEIVKNFSFVKAKQKNLVALSNSPLCSTPVYEKYRGQSIFKFSPIVKNLNEILEDIESEVKTNKPNSKSIIEGSNYKENLEGVLEDKRNIANCKNKTETDMFTKKNIDGEENSLKYNFVYNSVQDISSCPIQSKESFNSSKKDSIFNNDSPTSSHLEPFLGFSNSAKNIELEDILRKYKEIDNNISNEVQSNGASNMTCSFLDETEVNDSVSLNRAESKISKKQKNIGMDNENPQNLSVVTHNSESIDNATLYDTCDNSEDFEDKHKKEIVVVVERLNDSVLQRYYNKITENSFESNISKTDGSDSESCSSIGDTNSYDNCSKEEYEDENIGNDIYAGINIAKKHISKRSSCSSVIEANEAKIFNNYVPTKDSEDKTDLDNNSQIATDIGKLNTSKSNIFCSSDFNVTGENNDDIKITNERESCSIVDYVNISDNSIPRNVNEDVIDLGNCTQVAIDTDKTDLLNSIVDTKSSDSSLIEEYVDKTDTDNYIEVESNEDIYTSTESDSESNKSDDKIYVSFVNTRRRNNATKSYTYSENSYTSCCSADLEGSKLVKHDRNSQKCELITIETDEENNEIQERIKSSLDRTFTKNNQNIVIEKSTDLTAVDRKSCSANRKSSTKFKRYSTARKSYADDLKNNRNSEVNDNIVHTKILVKQRETIKPNTSIDRKTLNISPDIAKRDNLGLDNRISTCEIKQGIVLQPGKRWERSLSIYRRMSVMTEHFDESILDDEPLDGKGRKYRQSVINTMQMQELKGSLHNESIQSRRSTLIFKPHRSTISIIRESNSSRRTSSASLDDLQGFLTDDCDDTIVELSKLSIGDSEHEVTVLEKFHDTSNRIATARDYVLRRCNQPDVVLFDECYPDTVLKNCRKIGEGVYGEVFLWRAGDGRARVLKIVPIAGDVKVNGEQQKDYHEIISEIVIAMELSALRAPIPEIENHLDEGKGVETLDLHSVVNATDVFNEVLAAHVVYGSYPSRLLDLWELYDETKGSENDNPAVLPVDQQFLVLELANAGQDLESYQFNNAEQAYALFQQVAFGLAVGEEAFEFEHRDLHWGNVLIAPTDQKYATFVVCGRSYRVPRRGVAATIIDYSLSRVALPLGAGERGERAALYNDLAADEALFDAVGDYQFQVYRLMRDKLGNEWKNFEPYTNILWLHYTVDKMITALRYTRTNTKIHKHYIAKLKGIKNRILDYGSAVQYVLTDNEI